MKRIGSLFAQGLVAVLPITVTIYIIYWLGSSAEAVLGRGIRFIVPASAYWPGMGIAVGFSLVLVIGLLMRAWLVRKMFRLGEAIFERIPLVKTLYTAVRDFLGFFAGSDKQALGQVVSVAVGDSNVRLIGFVTREDCAVFTPGGAGTDTIAVYLPMSCQIGGYTAIVPRSAVQPVEMSVEEAMRFAITAGMGTKSGAEAEAGKK